MRRLWRRLGSLLHVRRAETELAREIAAHLSVLQDEFQRRGMTADEAHEAARRAFGGVEQAKELQRDERSFGWLEDLKRDLRYGLHSLRKHRSFAAIAILTLALGIGANSAMFAVLDAVVLRPLPYPAPDELAMLWTENPGQNLREGRTGYQDADQWRARSRSFADMAVYDPISMRLTAPGDLEQISVIRTSPNLFTLLGVRPLRGRLFTVEEARERRRVAVISHSMWQVRFGASPDVIGATIELDGVPSEVVGVLPPAFDFSDADVWEPHTLFGDWDVRRVQRGAGAWFVLGRMRPGVTLQQAQAELHAIALDLNADQAAGARAASVSVMPLGLHIVGPESRLALWLLTGAVFCVLLIAVTNITSMSLARNAGREREFAIRSALGASRVRVVRQLLAESLVLALLSGVVGLSVAALGVPFIVSMAPPNLPSLAGVTLDMRVIGWTLALSIAAGVMVGLLPAVSSGRRNIRAALDAGSRGTSSASSTRLTRRSLVVAEFALAIVLLVGAGLLVRSLMQVQRVDLGFNPERVLSMQLSLPPLDGAESRTSYYRQVLEQVEGVAGVEKAGVIGDFFIGGAAEQNVSLDGDASQPSVRLRVRRDEISSRFFETMGVSLRRGRGFGAEDDARAPRVAIVNDTLARRLWAGQDPIGKRFKFGPRESNAPWFTVVGLVGDMRRQRPEVEAVAQMFEPVAQNPSRLATLLVRTATPPMGMSRTLHAAVRRVDARAPAYSTATLQSTLDTLQTERRFQTWLLIAFSLVALLLAAIGIYGVVQYSIATRTREIGIRMAIGAQRTDIFNMVVGEGLSLSLAGVAIGLLGALWLGHVGSSLLFGVTATDPTTYLAVSLLLTLVAIVGCYVPARRASHVDPLVALRYD